LVHIIGVNKINPLTQGKDCPDFRPLKGGIVGDPKYCDLSLQCIQLDMKSDYCFFKDENGSDCFDYFCRGIKVRLSGDERKEDLIDEEVS